MLKLIGQSWFKQTGVFGNECGIKYIGKSGIKSRSMLGG